MIPYEEYRPSRREPITPAERRAGWLAWLAIVATFLLLALAGCRTTPRPDERPNASVVPPAVWPTPDTTRPAPTRPHNVANPAAGWPEASLPNRLTDAIGISTPEGRERRQAVRLARASVPRSIGKGAVYAVNSRVVTAYKAKAPTVQADSGATVSNAAEGSQQQAVKGNGNQLTADKHDTTQQAPGIGATIAKAIAGPLGYVLAVALAGAGVYLVWLIWAYLPKRKTDTAHNYPDNGQPS